MQTIGERLEEARKRKGISIREAAEATKIRSDYLHKFESNQFDLNLAEIYVRGFLRAYAIFLRVPADKILNDFAALGRNNSGNRPRQPSREIYGRMDVSIYSAEERTPEPVAPARNETPPSPPEAGQRPTNLQRSGSSLPKGPAISPTLIFRGGMYLAVVVVVALIAWGVWALVSDKAPASSDNHTSAAIVNPAGPTMDLVAVDTVRVKVTRRNSDGSSGDVILPDTTMVRGEVKKVSKPGPVYIWASEGNNLKVEINKKRYDMPFSGYNRAQID